MAVFFHNDEGKEGSLKGVLKEIVSGGWSLIAGMGVTIRRIYRPVVTLQYPRKRLQMSPSYRGHIELKKFPETGSHRCVACGTCMRVCPTKVIKVQGEKTRAHEEKKGTLYFIDFSHCSLCGLCVVNCPTKTLKFSEEYELAHYSRWEGVVDLVQRLQESA
ncbi:MAG: NADH-quinone oxidoreductase subunit I [Deltaproteobacteria bacterium]|nr:NADH-quinone oxidoreductase subunit I [Deltaproteobacteria bacterium]MBW2071243.1 NADH-quinone oxidoreductase subunit I [Deltaproteobacteria bacterium]